MKTPIWEKGQEGGRTRPIDKDNAYKNLCDVYDTLEKYGVKCCLCHGTLLGAVRENNIIASDDDVDIWADASSIKNREELEEDLRKQGFFVPPLGDISKEINPVSNTPYSDTVAIRGGEKVEVWWFVKKDDMYLYDIHRPHGTMYKHDKKYYEPLSEISFRGKKFKVPNFTEEWLVMAYGKEWKIPSKRKYTNPK